jgi:DNA-binding NarL/FixJ family response regulator
MAIRTLWLSKNNLFATSVSSLLHVYGISIVTVTDPEKAYPYFQAIEADLIIIDANWDKDDHWGVAFLANLHQRIPDLKSIFVTTTFQYRLCKKLEEAGAMGYFFRDSRNIENIVHCIRQVYSGTVCFGETDPALAGPPDDVA